MGFEVASYDHTRPLVIDPVLAYSTYLGGMQADLGFRIVVDSSGSAYITGATNSNNFPTSTGAYRTSLAPGMCNFGTKVFPCPDAFVTKLNPSGSLVTGGNPAVAYSTYLGGSRGDAGIGIAFDSTGNTYVTGFTTSFDFPTTPGAYKTMGAGKGDAFVTKLNPTGSALVYSTFLGGSNDDIGMGIAVDGSGNAFVTGATSSTDFPTAGTPFQGSNGGGAICATSFFGRSALCYDAFVTKLDSAGATLLYSTYLGGNADDGGTAIAVDSSGSAYLTGATSSTNFPTQPNPGAIQSTNGGGTCKARGETFDCPDAFVAKVDPTGSTLVYSTYLGGSGSDAGFDIALDSSGNAYVTGGTNSADFPTTSGAFQTTSGGSMCGPALKMFPCPHAFVTKLDPTGTSRVYSTYLRGSNADVGVGIALDTTVVFNLQFRRFFTTDAIVVGSTNSPDFPTVNPIHAFGGGNCSTKTLTLTCPNAFVTELDEAGSAELFSTFLGGAGGDIGFGIAVDGSGNVYVTGATRSADFPTATAFQPALGGLVDAFVTKISPPPTRASVSPTSLTFGNQAVNTTSGAQTVTLTNTGNGPLTITGIAISPDFAQTNNCNGSVAAGASCTIRVTFTPTASGPRNGTMSINDNAPGSPQTVALSGTGTDFSIAAASGSSTSATVTAGGIATYTLAFTGSTGFTGMVSLACSGAPPASTCTPNPNPVTLSGTSTVNATVSVATMARAMAAPQHPTGPPAGGRYRGLPQLFWWLLAVTLASLVVAKRRRASLGASAAVLCVLLFAALAMPACGGGGGGGVGGGGGGTPAGTYTLAVTSTYTSGSSMLTHKTNLTLTVQ